MTRIKNFIPKITKEEFKSTGPHYCKCKCSTELLWKDEYRVNGKPEYSHGHHSRKNNNHLYLPLIVCGCGCKKYIPLIDNYRENRKPKYIQGHNNRGKKFSTWDGVKPIYICQCGCNQIIPWQKGHRWHSPKYIKSHALKKTYGHSKGKPLSEEHKKKVSESMKGIVPWNKGKPTPQETIKKISKSNTGKKRSEEFCLNNSKRHKGKVVSEETKEKLRQYKGEKSSSWKGGISWLPYCDKFNEPLKEAVRERDLYTCQLCGKLQEENYRKLPVHHIHYDKENCYPDLICLCSSCNPKVNTNRDYYENLFMNKLNDNELLFWTKRKIESITN